MSVQLVNATQVNPTNLNAFLKTVYRHEKTEFLCRHSDWWYHDDKNRLVLLDDDAVIGYCAVIPVRCKVNAQVVSGIWWVDIIIAPNCRGRGFHSILDRKVKELAALKLGFPNEMAAKIHQRKGWGVRNDLRVFLMPLRPARIGSVVQSKGVRGIALKLTASILSPFLTVFRLLIQIYSPGVVWTEDEPSAAILESIFAKTCEGGVATTYRDQVFFEQRYLQAPYSKELTFFFAGNRASPTHYLIARFVESGSTKVARILDLFGDFADRKTIRSLLLSVLKEAVLRDCSQVTIMATMRELVPILRSTGFLFSSVSRFCWFTDSQTLMDSFRGKIYWTLADSDNDEPA